MWPLHFLGDFLGIFNIDTYYYPRLLFNVKVKQIAVKFEIEKFNGNNFGLWKMKMNAILRKENCLEAIGESLKNVEDKK